VTLPTEFLLYVADLLDRLEIPYHVGGSVASSAHGMYRASADVDFVIDPTADQLDALASALEAEFYVSRTAIAEALARRSTFNAIHDLTSFKIDFFIKGSALFDAEGFRRSIPRVVNAERRRAVLLKSPEDTILAAMRGQLDEQHLDRWSRELEVADLLERARQKAADF
jgi:hypothetical protein